MNRMGMIHTRVRRSKSSQEEGMKLWKSFGAEEEMEKGGRVQSSNEQGRRRLKDSHFLSLKIAREFT